MALAVAIALIALVPAARILTHRAVWREVQFRPWLALAGAVALLAMLAALARAWPLPMVIVPTAVSVLVILTTFATWRARDTYGASRKLPPGSLSLRTSLDALTDPRFYARTAAQYGPVFKMAQFHRPVACIVDLPLGLELLARQRETLRDPTLPFGRRSPGDLVAFLDDDQHVRHRPVLRTALTGNAIAQCQDGVANIVQAELVRAAREHTHDGLDPRRLLDRVTFASVCHVLLGYPAGDSTIGALRPLITSRNLGDGKDMLSQAVALVRSTGSTPDEHPVLAALMRDDPRHLDDDVVLGNLVLIAHVTRSNIRGVLGWTLKELLDHPKLVNALRGAATSGHPPAVNELATRIVQETLRLHQSEFFYREVTTDLQAGPYRIPRGWLVRVCVRECHDNPAVFPEPRVFRPERFIGRRYERTEYCPFSDGTHTPAGPELTMMVARTFATVLALHWNGHITRDGPIERDGNRHWNHWRPGSGLRVRLMTRSGPPED